MVSTAMCAETCCREPQRLDEKIHNCPSLQASESLYKSASYIRLNWFRIRSSSVHEDRDDSRSMKTLEAEENTKWVHVARGKVRSRKHRPAEADTSVTSTDTFSLGDII